jgi:hypothetical protein
MLNLTEFKERVEEEGWDVVSKRRENVSDLKYLNNALGFKLDDTTIGKIANSAVLGETADLSFLTFEQKELLEDKLDSLNLNQEAYETLSKGLKEYETAVINAAANDRKNYEGLSEVRRELTQIQESLDMTATAWDNYADAVAKALGVTDDETFTTGFARVTARATAAITGLTKAWSDYSETLNDPNLLSPDFAKALGEIEIQLKNWIGQDKLDISQEFLMNNLDTIKEFAQGNLTNLSAFMNKLTFDTMDQYNWNTKT